MDTTNSANAPDQFPSAPEALDAHVAAFEAHEGSLYGLQDWSGLAILDRAEVTTSRWHEEPFPVVQHYALTLKYLSGNHEEGWNDPERPFVLVTTTDETEQSLPWHLVVRAERTRPYEQSEELTPEATLRNSRQSTVAIPVDGVVRRAELVTRGDCFAGRVDVGGRVVIIVGRSISLSELKLATVDDLSAVVQSWRRLTDRLRG